MSEIRIASRYAKSILELAREKGVLEDVHNDMQNFSAVVGENYELLLALKNPIIKPDKKKAILNAIFHKVNPMTKAFFDIITRKNRTDVLPDVANEFRKQYNLLKGIQVAKITTAAPLDDKLRDEFISLIKEISSKDDVQLKEIIDEDIIGGFILRVGDKQVDGSIKSKLTQLQRDLTKNQYVKEF